MTGHDAAERWQTERTTFQRVYDVVLGAEETLTAATVADRAACSETGARKALEQLSEMGIVERDDGRPVAYRRNDAYLTWRRVEELARDRSPEELREQVDELISDDEAFQEQFGVPDPDAVTVDDASIDDADAVHDRWDALGDWRTVRRDIPVLRRAIQRAESRRDDRAQA